MAIVNYVFTLMSLSRFSTYEYHHDYVLIGMNLDWLIHNRRSVVQSSSYAQSTVSVLAYEVPVFLGIALVYFDSALYKLFSPMWMAGLGLWQPASTPYATFFDWSWLLDQQVLMKGLGFLVILFEATFIFLMWSRRATCLASK